MLERTMQNTHQGSSSVLVGIDGSRAAVAAALWAVDEAVNRHIPVRLVYAIEPHAGGEADQEIAARRFATAELAIRQAVTAVESTNKPVKTEVEILHGKATAELLQASGSAALLCVGAVGLKHLSVGRLGSTAATLASSAHCPVAIIQRDDGSTIAPRAIVAEFNESACGTEVLETSVGEARLRGSPLRVLNTWQSRLTDIHDAQAVTDGNRRAKVQLDRHLARWRRQNPDLDIESVAAHCTTLRYLTLHAKDTQLLVIGRERVPRLTDAAPRLEAALHDTNCSVLVCRPHASL
jgi:nucleotide-binding universal stress UspA family protein